MTRPRVLVIGLDGLEISVAERLMAAGEMPALAELRRRAACFRLDHGPAQRTGLAWEHVASGLAPEAGRRWAAVEFDPTSYTAWQEGARFTPWWAGLDRRVVVFDTPYVDLRRAPNTRGIVGWGAHDPGTLLTASPNGFLGEFKSRIGPYPAPRWTYGIPFPSSDDTREMGEALGRALDLRADAARWLATERLPDWDLFIAVAGELHGAVEGLWHGIDPSHPLHKHPSAAAAEWALVNVHRSLDRLVGRLMPSDGHTALIAFNPGGMGPNHSDVASMVLLPDLLYRHAFGHPLLSVPSEWSASPDGMPIIEDGVSWTASSKAWVPPIAAERNGGLRSGALRSLARRLPTPIKGVLKGARAAVADWRARAGPTARQDLHWQPALRYRRHWPCMPAFALPSFYDGRIRLNVRGRERYGMIEPSRYEEACEAIASLLRECRNPRTGDPAVDVIERADTREPLAVTGSEADLIIVWRGVVTALEHPRLGLVGPVPLRRTGGHTGRYGVAYMLAPGLDPGDRGVRSAFDVVPTIVDLLGDPPAAHMSGTSLL